MPEEVEIERLNEELRRRTRVVRIFPNAASCMRLIRALCVETHEGWRESTRGARSWAQLPATAIKYIRRLEELIGAPVALLSTSPEREDTILVRDPFIGR